MRILCDQNVHEKYVETFRDADLITVSTVRDELSADADDPVISNYAETNDWVVFTDDDDFLSLDYNHGLVLYIQIENPSPGDVLDALTAINYAYDDDSNITEYVPGKWV